MPEQIGHRALVIGGSVAGIAAARVLSERYAEVVVLERDLDGTSRRGAPQREHAHILLRRGVDLAEQWFPGILREMESAGVVPFDFGRDLKWFNYGRWLPRRTSGVMLYPQTRDSLEGHLRRRLDGEPNVRFLSGCRVTGLISDLEGRRIVGVQAVGPKGEGQIAADLVVYAGGRSRAVYRWLEALSFPAVESTTLQLDLRYVSCTYRLQPRPRDWTAIWVSPNAPRSPYAGALVRLGEDRWLLSLAGYHGDVPSADPERFQRFAEKLPIPDIARALRGAQPLDEPTAFRFGDARWHHIDRAERWPARLLVVGDAWCNFDPVFGQGMTVAMDTCDRVGSLLDSGALDGAGIQRFYRETGRRVGGSWAVLTAESLRHPKTPGERTDLVRATQSFVELLYEVVHEDPSLYPRFVELLHMRVGPEMLMRPDVSFRLGSRAWRRWFGSRPGAARWALGGPQ